LWRRRTAGWRGPDDDDRRDDDGEEELQGKDDVDLPDERPAQREEFAWRRIWRRRARRRDDACVRGWILTRRGARVGGCLAPDLASSLKALDLAPMKGTGSGSDEGDWILQREERRRGGGRKRRRLGFGLGTATRRE
jgi:hypothetical protein